MDNAQKTGDGEITKGKSMLTASEVVQKICVYCYEVKILDHNMDGVINKKIKKLMIIGNNKKSIDKSTKDKEWVFEGYSRSKYYKLERSFEMSPSEVSERFNLDEEAIDEILGEKNLKLDKRDLKGTDYLSDCYLSIEELREKRRIDSEPFDAEEIISKIASEYLLTPKRKEALLNSIKKLV